MSFHLFFYCYYSKSPSIIKIQENNYVSIKFYLLLVFFTSFLFKNRVKVNNFLNKNNRYTQRF